VRLFLLRTAGRFPHRSIRYCNGRRGVSLPLLTLGSPTSACGRWQDWAIRPSAPAWARKNAGNSPNRFRPLSFRKTSAVDQLKASGNHSLIKVHRSLFDHHRRASPDNLRLSAVGRSGALFRNPDRHAKATATTASRRNALNALDPRKKPAAFLGDKQRAQSREEDCDKQSRLTSPLSLQNRTAVKRLRLKSDS